MIILDLFTIRRMFEQGQTIFSLPLSVTYYTRVSTDKEQQLHSLSAQTDYFEEYIKKNTNWTLVAGYIEEGITGTSVRKRDAFNEMIEDGLNGKFDLILTKEVTIDSLFYTRELLKANVGVFFINDNICTLYNEGELRLTIMSSLAQDESRKISSRVLWGHRRAMEKGTVFGNNKILGYEKNKGKLVVVEEEAKLVRHIYDLYASGKYGIRSLSDKLASEGYFAESGRPYAYTSLKGILSNTKYKGLVISGRHQTIDFLTKERVATNPESWIKFEDEDRCPPIVDTEIWEKVQVILQDRAKFYTNEETNPSNQVNKYLYSGKIICAKHNEPFWHAVYHYSTGDRHLWQCKTYRQKGKAGCSSPTIYTDELNYIVGHLLDSMFKDKKGIIDRLTNMIADIMDEVSYDNDIKELMKKIEKVQKQKNKIYEAYSEDAMSLKEFKERNQECDEQIKALEGTIKQYEDLNKVKFDSTTQLRFIKDALNKNYDFINNFNDEIVETFLDRIYVYDGEDENTYTLQIILKSGIKIPSIFIRDPNRKKGESLDMRKALPMHIIRASRMSCEFKKNKWVGNNEIVVPPIKYNCEALFDLGA